MPWWFIVLLIVAGCFALAIVMLLPFAGAMGAVYGVAAKRAGNQEAGDAG